VLCRVVVWSLKNLVIGLVLDPINALPTIVHLSLLVTGIANLRHGSEFCCLYCYDHFHWVSYMKENGGSTVLSFLSETDTTQNELGSNCALGTTSKTPHGRLYLDDG
jgi:hypothetical protein